MAQRKNSVEIYRLIRETEDQMITEIQENLAKERGSSVDDKGLRSYNKLIESDHPPSIQHCENQNPKLILYKYFEGKE